MLREPPPVRQVPRPGATEVVLTAEAERGLREQLVADGYEEGGYLYGRRLDGEIRVEAFTRIHDNFRAPLTCTLDSRMFRDMADHYSSVGWRALGCWHTHPKNGIEPSELDRRAWALSAREFRIPWLSLILTARDTWDRPDWFPPEYGCWLTTPGADAITPCRLIVETETQT